MGGKRSETGPPALSIRWLRDGSESGVPLGLSPVVLWDKDSTLADTTQRQHILARIKPPKGEPRTATWDEYSLAAGGDAVFPGAAALMRLLSSTAVQIIMTGASEVAFGVVRAWLDDNDLPADGIAMRPAGCYLPNPELKVSWIRQLQARGVLVRLFLEDWDDCARMIYAQTGVPVLGVNPFYPERKEIPPAVPAAPGAALAEKG